MKSKTFIVKSFEALEQLFSVLDEGLEQAGIYGSQQHLSEMPRYELDFTPYTALAKNCGMKSISLRRSEDTGRVYLWNVNISGHGPRLELLPVSFSQVKNIHFMQKMHVDHAYFLSLAIDVSANYKI